MEDVECEPAAMDSEDVLFLLYTSGSTGNPKGLVHTQAGYLLYTSLTHRVTTHTSYVDIRRERHPRSCVVASVGEMSSVFGAIVLHSNLFADFASLFGTQLLSTYFNLDTAHKLQNAHLM